MRQQEAIRAACLVVLGRVPAKGTDAKETFTDEVRTKIADVMLRGYKQEVVAETDKSAWFIKDFRSPEAARKYITGKGRTDLLQFWTQDPAAAKTSVSAPKRSVAERLADLNALKGAITDEVYATKLAEILAAV